MFLIESNDKYFELIVANLFKQKKIYLLQLKMIIILRKYHSIL